MTPRPTSCPNFHGSGLHRLVPDHDGVEDEYVFLVTAPATDHADERQVVSHSIRIDPDECHDEELVLHVTKRRRDGTSTVDSESYIITVPAPGLGDPLRTSALTSTLEAWFNQYDGPETSLETWLTQYDSPETSQEAVPARDGRSQ